MAPRDADFDDAATEVDETANVTSEQTPLLPADSSDVVPSKSFQRLVMAMTFIFLFTVEVAQYMMDAPSTAIMEDILCHQRYPDHVAYYVAHAQDPRCKEPQVQKTLALVKSWIYSAEMFVPLLVQIPYGILADKIGRRPVLFLSLLGILLDTAWQLFVLSFPNIFPVWAVAPGATAYLIGGGGPMAAAMLWTIVADATPAEQRTRNFYLLHASVLGINILVKPISAFVMNFDPWLNMWTAQAAVLLATILTLFMPETLGLRQQAAAKDVDEPDEEVNTSPDPKRSTYELAWNSTKDAVAHVWHFIFTSNAVLVLLACQVTSYIVDQTFQIFQVQYAASRFNWSWATSVYVSNINNITAIFILLGVLPIASSVLTKRYGLGSVSRDLFLARISIVVVTIGTAMVAFSMVSWFFILSLVVYSIGYGFQPLCRGMLVAIVEPHTLATLNTTISAANSIMGLLIIPAFGWLLGRGLELGGVLSGLPFLVAFGSSLLITVALFLWRVPRGVENSQSS